MNVTRRNLIGASAVGLAGSILWEAAMPVGSARAESNPFRLDSPPILQHPSDTGMTVAWAVTHRSVGWVEYGETKSLGSRAGNSRFGLQQMDSTVLTVRLDNLKPGTTYYYRAGSAPIDFAANRTIRRGPDVLGEIYSFTTTTSEAKEASFALINDTHEQSSTLKSLFAALDKEPADFTIWDGDVFNTVESEKQIVEQLLRPTGAAYATKKPLLFIPGNHDIRGEAARAGALSRFVPPWNSGPTGYSFVLRHGPLAILGLDTGEDKEDDHPYLAHTTDFAAYRLAQRAWLEKAVQREEFRSAPCKIAVFHIPLYGAWSSPLHRKQWSDVLSKAGVQLIICGHDHSYRYDPPSKEHSFGQLVGGGPSLRQATLIRGRATAERLSVRMLDIDGKEVWSGAFPAGMQ